MEDNTTDIFLFSILILFFAVIVGTFSDSNDTTFEQPIIEKKSMLNKWRRIY